MRKPQSSPGPASPPRTSPSRRPKKTWKQKLADDKDLPKVIRLEGAHAKRWGGVSMVIPRPRDVDALIRRIRRGTTATVNELRQKLAARHGTDIACPITTGIFAWIASHAAMEDEVAGRKQITPWWRLLKEGNRLNPCFPGGTAEHSRRLRSEGHTIRNNRLVQAPSAPSTPKLK